MNLDNSHKLVFRIELDPSVIFLWYEGEKREV